MLGEGDKTEELLLLLLVPPLTQLDGLCEQVMRTQIPHGNGRGRHQ